MLVDTTQFVWVKLYIPTRCSEYLHLLGVIMSLELSIIKGLCFGIEYVNGEDLDDEEVGVYVVIDLGFLRLLLTTYR